MKKRGFLILAIVAVVAVVIGVVLFIVLSGDGINEGDSPIRTPQELSARLSDMQRSVDDIERVFTDIQNQGIIDAEALREAGDALATSYSDITTSAFVANGIRSFDEFPRYFTLTETLDARVPEFAGIVKDVADIMHSVQEMNPIIRLMFTDDTFTTPADMNSRITAMYGRLAESSTIRVSSSATSMIESTQRIVAIFSQISDDRCSTDQYIQTDICVEYISLLDNIYSQQNSLLDFVMTATEEPSVLFYTRDIQEFINLVFSFNFEEVEATDE